MIINNYKKVNAFIKKVKEYHINDEIIFKCLKKYSK